MTKKLLTRKVARKLFYVEDGVLRWRVDWHGMAHAGDVAGTRVHEYMRVSVFRQFYPAHHIVWLMKHGYLPIKLDHKNGIGVDNRLKNLRECNDQENLQNQRKARADSKSGVLGVHWHKGVGKWTSRIVAYGVAHRLGYFDKLEEAQAAYLAAKEKLHPFETISSKRYVD